MVPDTREWRTSTEYDYMDEVDTDNLAWECLRRNARYQTDFSTFRDSEMRLPPDGESISTRWGYDFPARPSLTGLEQTVFWTPEADSNALHIGPSPEIPFTDPRFSSDFHPAGQKSAIEGLHLSFDTGRGHIHLILFAGLQPNEPSAPISPRRLWPRQDRSAYTLVAKTARPQGPT